VEFSAFLLQISAMIVFTGRCIPLCHSVVQLRSFVADTRVECTHLGVLLNAVDVIFFFLSCTHAIAITQ